MTRSVEERLADLERKRAFQWAGLNTLVGYTSSLALIALMIVGAAAVSLVLAHWALSTWGVVQ